MSKEAATREMMWEVFQVVLDSLITDLKDPERKDKARADAIKFLKNNGITAKHGADPEDVIDGLLGLDVEVFEDSLITEKGMMKNAKS